MLGSTSLGTLHTGTSQNQRPRNSQKLLLIVQILHDLKEPKLWELWYIPYSGQWQCRLHIINRMGLGLGIRFSASGIPELKSSSLGALFAGTPCPAT